MSTRKYTNARTQFNKLLKQAMKDYNVTGDAGFRLKVLDAYDRSMGLLSTQMFGVLLKK